MFQRFFGGENAIPAVSAPEGWKRLSQNGSRPVLIDVREEWEYQRGHARGAKNIPLSQIRQRHQELPRDREILVICQSGHRSMQAAKFLQQQGIEQVMNVTGGTSAWRMHGLPLE
jgi:rhodanese-related sulfurtransferase